MSNKVAIIGVRNPSISYENWKEKYQDLILSYKPESIVSGGAKGIDSYAKKLSDDLNIFLLVQNLLRLPAYFRNLLFFLIL